MHPGGDCREICARGTHHASQHLVCRVRGWRTAVAACWVPWQVEITPGGWVCVCSCLVVEPGAQGSGPVARLQLRCGMGVVPGAVGGLLSCAGRLQQRTWGVRGWCGWVLQSGSAAEVGIKGGVGGGLGPGISHEGAACDCRLSECREVDCMDSGFKGLLRTWGRWR